MSLISRLTGVGLQPVADHVGEGRFGLRVSLPNATPNPEQLADALLAAMKFTPEDLAAYKEQTGVDLRQHYIGIFEAQARSGNAPNFDALRRTGDGYTGYIGISKEEYSRLTNFVASQQDLRRQSAGGGTQTAAAVEELRNQGAVRRQLIEASLTPTAVGATAYALPKLAGELPRLPQLAPIALQAAPVIAEVAPVVVIGATMLAPAVITATHFADRYQEMADEAEKQTARPTAEKDRPVAPTIPDTPTGGELVPTDGGTLTPTATTAGRSEPTTNAPGPQNSPEETPPSSPRFDPGRDLPPLIAGAGTGILANEMLRSEPQPSRTEPSLPPDPGRVPRGKPETLGFTPRSVDEIRQAEDLQLQRESAELLARAGYDVEYRHNKPISAEEAAADPRLKQGRRPDYSVEGRIFDHLAPQEGTSVRNIVTRSIKRDKIDNGQAMRFVVNLDRSKITLEEFREQLRTHPVDNLDEIIIIRGGQVVPFFPFDE